MGVVASKCRKEDKEEASDEGEEFVYDTAQMLWDEHGNLRYGE